MASIDGASPEKSLADLPPELLGVVVSFCGTLSTIATLCQTSSSLRASLSGLNCEPSIRGVLVSRRISTQLSTSSPLPWRRAAHALATVMSPSRVAYQKDDMQPDDCDFLQYSASNSSASPNLGSVGAEELVDCAIQIAEGIHAYGLASGAVRVVFGDAHTSLPTPPDSSELRPSVINVCVGAGSIRHMQCAVTRKGRIRIFTGSWCGYVNRIDIDFRNPSAITIDTLLVGSGPGPVSALILTSLADPGSEACAAGGNTLVYALGQGALRIVDVPSSAQLIELNGHKLGATDLCVVGSSSARLLVSSSYDASLLVWGLYPPFPCLARCESHRGPIWSLASAATSSSGLFSVFSAGADGDIRLWDFSKIAATMHNLPPLDQHRQETPTLIAAPILVIHDHSTTSRRAQIWCLYSFGNTLVGGTSSGDIHGWNARSGAHCWKFNAAEVISTGMMPLSKSAGFTADGRREWAEARPASPGLAQRDGVRRLFLSDGTIVATMAHGSIARFHLSSTFPA
jgi:hypothetical protein